jgi:hypothetical protein
MAFAPKRKQPRQHLGGDILRQNVQVAAIESDLHGEAFKIGEAKKHQMFVS